MVARVQRGQSFKSVAFSMAEAQAADRMPFLLHMK